MLTAVMVDSSGSFQLVSIAEAARILNVSDSTVRRLVKSGRLESQQVQRPQGHVWLVKVPADSTDPMEQPSRQIGAAPADPPGPPALTAWMTSVLEPLMAELAASRDQLVAQAETIGELRAQNATLTASTARQDQNPAHWPSGIWRRSLAVYGAAIIAAVVVVVVIGAALLGR